MATPNNAAIVRDLTAASAARNTDAAALQNHLTTPGHDQIVKRVRTAQATGEIREDVDPDVLADALAAALLYVVLDRRDEPATIVARLLGLLLHGAMELQGAHGLAGAADSEPGPYVVDKAEIDVVLVSARRVRVATAPGASPGRWRGGRTSGRRGRRRWRA
ncbi:TetR/AcrR family transcriptional regulator C-terminal ligand-binding domain-containing protein [Myceligenerans indicum]|uniref:Tetracyclin repressor-like C-terminal domain-containing protein n=1 Tax=Myceligenerans indicum TaxID=2593663 RepID=A0ABS1LS66_9MICO|nr:hypothetical protein [Myceligenerans indicum]